MDRRQEPRLRIEFPVRIWGVDRMACPFAEVVRVKNVSLSGAVLLGVRSKLRAGELLDVQHGSQRAQFRIAWGGIGGGRDSVLALRTLYLGNRTSYDVGDGGNWIIEPMAFSSAIHADLRGSGSR